MLSRSWSNDCTAASMFHLHARSNTPRRRFLRPIQVLCWWIERVRRNYRAVVQGCARTAERSEGSPGSSP